MGFGLAAFKTPILTFVVDVGLRTVVCWFLHLGAMLLLLQCTAKAIFGYGDRVAVGRCALAEASAGGISVTFTSSLLSWWNWSGLLIFLSVAGWRDCNGS